MLIVGELSRVQPPSTSVSQSVGLGLFCVRKQGPEPSKSLGGSPRGAEQGVGHRPLPRAAGAGRVGHHGPALVGSEVVGEDCRVRANIGEVGCERARGRGVTVPVVSPAALT